MICKRGHGKFFQTNFIQQDGTIKIKCDYIMGYKMKGDSGTRVILCGDLKIGDSLPITYIALTEISI